MRASPCTGEAGQQHGLQGRELWASYLLAEPEVASCPEGVLPVREVVRTNRVACLTWTSTQHTVPVMMAE